jgi:hypothetical protein
MRNINEDELRFYQNDRDVADIGSFHRIRRFPR